MKYIILHNSGVNRLMQNDVQQMKNHQQSSMPVYGSMQHDNNKMKHFQNMNNNPANQKLVNKNWTVINFLISIFWFVMFT